MAYFIKFVSIIMVQKDKSIPQFEIKQGTHLLA